MTTNNTRRPGELPFAFALVAFSFAALWLAYGISGLTSLSSAGVFPMLASGTMALAALFNLAGCLAKQQSDDAGGPGLIRFVRDILPPLHVALLGLILLYLLVMPWLGFTVSSGLFLFTSFLLLWRKGLVTTLMLTGVSLGVIYVVFRIVFQVVLPQGSLLRGLF
tara:strand:- start:10454 stop:10948 length:495 start_codon:yes stop_codon:yes gene_type:complete